MGVKKCYFPIFVLNAEVSWLTKSRESDLVEHVELRSTAETVMYAAYVRSIKSYRDLPIRLNQGTTSHHLGQNFLKMLQITYDDPETLQKQYVHQNSWGITIRTEFNQELKIHKNFCCHHRDTFFHHFPDLFIFGRET